MDLKATDVDVQTANAAIPAIADHFWACDRRGMDQLNDYMRSCYDILDNVQALYKGRAELEQDFGEKLMALHKKLAPKEAADGISATQRIVSTLYQEVEKSAQSHIDMSGRLQNEVASQLGTWVKDRRTNLDQLLQSLDGLYKERQEKISVLLRIQDYQKKHNEYVSAVTNVNQSVDEWNTTWRNACEEIESVEQERTEFFFNNVWEYANLASARLLVQDEWCENVRTCLEEYNLQDDIIYCVNQYGTGGQAPNTSGYVDFFADKIVNKELPPQPQTMSNAGTHTQRYSPDHGHKSSTVSGSINVKRKPLGGSSKDATLNALLKKFEQPPSTSKQPERSHNHHPPVPSLNGRPEISKKPHHNLPPLSIKPPKSPKPPPLQLTQGMAPSSSQLQQQQQQQHPPRSPAIPKTDTSSRSPNIEHPSSQQQQPQQPPRSPAIPKADIVSRPPNMQHPPSHYNRQQQQQQQPRSPALGARDMPYLGQYQQGQYQQPPRSPVVQHGHPVMPVTADMAPRSPIQQHYSPWSSAILTTPVDTAYQQQQQQQQQQQHMYQQHMYQPTAPAQQIPVSAEYAPRSPVQGYTGPPRSPVAPHHPMGGYDVTQQRSPAIQQTSASMAPRSPMTLHQAPMTPADMYPRSPTIAPAAGYADYSNLQQQRWTTQNSNTIQQQNYAPPQWAGSTAPYDLPDGRRVQFWARALYDRTAEDETEISFQKGNLFAVMGESEDSGWWNAELWDEKWHVSLGAGCIPSNFMCTV